MILKDISMHILKELEKEDIIFLNYGGIFTQTLVVALSDILEKELENDKLDVTTFTKLIVIFVEMSQNIMKYTDPSEKGIIAVVNLQDSFKIFGANIITNEQKEIIQSRLEDIEKLSKDELRKRYKEIRKSGHHTHERGGGIGFYEIARKSDKLEYEFINEDGKTWFVLKAIINKKESK